MKKRIIRLEEIPYETFLNDIKVSHGNPEPPQEKKKKLATLQQAAEFFQVSTKTIYNWSRHKILERIEIGHRVYFEWEAIEELLKKNTVNDP